MPGMVRKTSLTKLSMSSSDLFCSCPWSPRVPSWPEDEALLHELFALGAALSWSCRDQPLPGLKSSVGPVAGPASAVESALATPGLRFAGEISVCHWDETSRKAPREPRISTWPWSSVNRFFCRSRGPPKLRPLLGFSPLGRSSSAPSVICWIRNLRRPAPAFRGPLQPVSSVSLPA